MSDIRRKIMMVDDNIANLAIGRNLLKSHYGVYLASSAAQMFEQLEKIRPDLILLDIEMPETDGYETISKLKATRRFAEIPVVFLTAENNEESEMKGFDLGAADYISKPFSPPLLLKRIEHQLIIVQQQKKILSHTNNLSALVNEKIGEVISLQNAILGIASDLVEFRDPFTGGHIARTQHYLKIMMDGLRENGVYKTQISGWDLESVLQSAQLHDIGKIGIPDAILNKPGRLTPEEFEVMKTHVLVGIDAVNRMISKTKEHTFLRHTRNIVGAHHEKWDGTGYPYGLQGESIPLEGRLMAVADVYDALVSWRPYKKSLSHAQASKIIQESGGTHFDPALVDVFLSIEKKFEQVSAEGVPNGEKRWEAITFTVDMEINPEIDRQHQELIDRLNVLISAKTAFHSKEETRNALDFLGSYVIHHFSSEETLQKQSRYPKYKWHKDQHQFFVGEYQKLQAEFAGNGFSATFTQTLSSAITDWIVWHIKSADVEFGKYYRAYTSSGKADASLDA